MCLVERGGVPNVLTVCFLWRVDEGVQATRSDGKEGWRWQALSRTSGASLICPVCAPSCCLVAGCRWLGPSEWFVSLCLSGNAFGGEAVMAMVQALGRPDCKLEALDLPREGLVHVWVLALPSMRFDS